MSFWSILTAVLGVAEKIVPIFIHNPASGAIEAAAATTANSAVAAASAGGNVAKIAAQVIGTAEQNIVPLVIHNPQTGEVAAVVASTAEGILQGMNQPQTTPPTT